MSIQVALSEDSEMMCSRTYLSGRQACSGIYSRSNIEIVKRLWNIPEHPGIYPGPGPGMHPPQL